MNILTQVWFWFVYQPQLNLTYFFYELAGDIGWAIVLVAIFINIPLWPLFAKSYVMMQKTKILQPKIKELMEKHKNNPQEMMKQRTQFYKDHNLSNTASLQILLIQLFFVSGLFWLVRDISTAENGQIDGLYEFLFNQTTASFEKTAFGIINIGESVQNYFYILVIGFVLSLAYGYYTFKLAPRPNLPIKYKNEEEEQKAKAMEQSQYFTAVYFTPILLLVIYWNTQAGLSLYLASASFMSLIRQIFVTNYYANHIEKLVDDIAKTDPITNEDTDPIIDVLSTDAVATKSIDAKEYQPEKTEKKEKKEINEKPKKLKKFKKKNKK